MRLTQNGMTIIELVVAICIAAIISSLALFLYSVSLRGFFSSARTANQIHEGIRIKRHIDKALANMSLVEDVQQGHVQFRRTNDTLLHELEFRSGMVMLDGSAIDRGIARIIFGMENSDLGKKAIFWEAATHSGVWIAGAALSNK